MNCTREEIPILQNSTEHAYIPENITYLSYEERLIFTIVFAILLLISVAGNVSAIVVTTQRNHRFIQKTSLISLSTSDLIMTLAYCTNNIETFSHPMINWTLGTFLCSCIPMLQIFGLVVNLASMVVIALDRYFNVVKVLARRWNPSRRRCILGFLLIWIACLGVSYPIYPMFEIKTTKVYPNLPNPYFEVYEFCVTAVKEQLKTYYIIIASLVFSTLGACFLFLNISIAHLVWSHRKPICSINGKYESSFSNETSTTQLSFGNQSTEGPTKKVQSNASASSSRQIKRKTRTFKIIMFSMFIFTACRLPFWLFNIVKLSDKHTEKCHWIMVYCFNALALLNCAINPLLYSFLQPTLCVLCKLGAFVKKIGKWYCSATEFDEFGKENPFCTEIKQKQLKHLQISKYKVKTIYSGKGNIFDINPI